MSPWVTKQLKQNNKKGRSQTCCQGCQKDKSEESPVSEIVATEKKTGDKKRPTKIKMRSKRYIEAAKMVDKNKLYALSDAVSLVKQTSLTKFDGTVELHINLNPLALSDKGDKKDFRVTLNLPHSTGKTIKVVIADEAIISDIAAGKINFDILVAHPSMMPQLAKVARVLGPKGLMPNPKTGTVTPDPEKRVKELTSGQVNVKTEPSNPIIHMAVGKVSFPDKQIAENITAVLKGIGMNKLAKISLTATMGPSVRIVLN